MDIAFHVDAVLGIHRVSWNNIIKPGNTVSTSEDGVSTGIVKINGVLIIILDFEKIVTDINPETGLKLSEIEALGERSIRDTPILIQQCKADGTLREHVQCVITDIEMPEMDGHRLTKLIKDDEETKHIPVVIFSSLVNDEMKRKGKALGADAQLSKPEIGNLVHIVDDLLQ